MKVSELIAKLQAVDPDMTVYVRAVSEPCAGCVIQATNYAYDVWVSRNDYDDCYELYIGYANEGTKTIQL